MSTSDKCPQCGAEYQSNTGASIQFKCGSLVRHGHVSLEHSRCLLRQRNALRALSAIIKLKEPASRWIPLSERRPTEEDGDRDHCVLCWHPEQKHLSTIGR